MSKNKTINDLNIEHLKKDMKYLAILWNGQH